MRLSDITVGTRVGGLDRDPVTVVAVVLHGDDVATLTYRTMSGALHEELVYGSDTERLSLVPDELPASFTADGALFKLVAEAMRIQMAGLFDPMLAVTSSVIEPLPHQIRAVYGEMLPKPGPLRFLLADDPGAGKTIMAGLYLKELILRGDVTRALIVAPGGLVEQWQEELAEKFGLEFTILTRSLAEADLAGDPFSRHPLLIARMDQLSRDETWLGMLADSEWDLVVVDEAHRMSAHYYSTTEVSRTRRYELGQLLDGITRHLLLMTATPHAGKEEDYQLFLALLDPDRFEGKYRPGAHSTDTSGLMRRMLKEDLLTFDGKPLFPERIAETVPYRLSGLEMALYEQVTDYVRDGMNRADRLADRGDQRRSRTVGFALTVLQRRLASSPEAIHRSLQRRAERLRRRRTEILATDSPLERVLAIGAATAVEPVDDFDPDELDAHEVEKLEDEVMDAATAAQTVAELDTEIAVLGDLERLAARVRTDGEDRKWQELRAVVLRAREDTDRSGSPRKLIVFTEHRDTLRYLEHRIAQLLGDPEAVTTIYGGTTREQRRDVRETFANDPRCQVLVATDAAGEGLNLQCAHLMVNYDLPWNPNRIEQRFGRIHRIGQREVCRLWNLVATDTREGQVFEQLLTKIEQQRLAYGGRVFDVLGETSFGERPLRDLLIEAIRYGEEPQVRARLDRVIDDSVSTGLRELMRERALATPEITLRDLTELRRQMDEARARRLQPHYIQLFVTEALRHLGGWITLRESGRYEVTHVPASVREWRSTGRGVGRVDVVRPVAPRYARVTFEPDRVAVEGAPQAELIAPGHPLMEALIAVLVVKHGALLAQSAALVDSAATAPDAAPRLVVALTEEIADGSGVPLSRRFSFVSLGPGGQAQLAGPAPYLDLAPLSESLAHRAEEAATAPWLNSGVQALALDWSIAHGLPAHRDEVKARVRPVVEQTRRLVLQRLRSQINFWDAQSALLAENQAVGRVVRLSPATAADRARVLDVRLERRLAELDLAQQVAVRPPKVAGAALVLPQSLVDRWRYEAGPSAEDVHPETKETAAAPGPLAVDTTLTERRAVDAVLAAERRIGREPEEMPHNNVGYDVRSLAPDGTTVFIEVKGRVVGADVFMVTLNEVLHGKNSTPHYRLALVSVDHDQPAGTDPVRYVLDPFAQTTLDSYSQTALVLRWDREWARGAEPM